MEKYDVSFSRFAFDDLEAIYRYFKIQKNAPEKAQELYEMIIDKANSLEYFPRRNPIANIKNNKYSNIRMLVVDIFMIFYTVNDDEKLVKIEKILRSGANWTKNI